MSFPSFTRAFYDTSASLTITMTFCGAPLLLTMTETGVGEIVQVRIIVILEARL